MPKLPKSDVDFEHPAKGPHHCSECRHFEPPDGSPCETVSEKGPPNAGQIGRGDWCNRFKPKRARQLYDHPRSRQAAKERRV